MEKISIIVPVYNVERYLPECLDSLLGQTYRELEIILVDDGSGDASGRICDAYGERDSRIRVIHQQNQGLSKARNHGLDIATGAYIAFVDSDDYVAEDMMEKMLSALRGAEADMVLCNFKQVDEAGNIFQKPTSIRNEVVKPRALLNRLSEERGWTYVVVWNRLYRKKVWEALRFPEDRIHEDEWVALSVYLACEKIALISDAYYYYRVNRNSIMAQSQNIAHLDGLEAVYHRFLKYQECGWEEQLYSTLLCARRMLEGLKHMDVKTAGEKEKRRRAIMQYRHMLRNVKEPVPVNCRIVGRVPVLYFNMKKWISKMGERIHG